MAKGGYQRALINQNKITGSPMSLFKGVCILLNGTDNVLQKIQHNDVRGRAPN